MNDPIYRTKTVECHETKIDETVAVMAGDGYETTPSGKPDGGWEYLGHPTPVAHEDGSARTHWVALSFRKPCEHENAVTGCMFGRHTAGESGPVVAFTAEITITCIDCNTPFHFGHRVRFSEWRHRQAMLSIAPGPAPEETDYAPGQFRCPVCLFHLTSKNLDPRSGIVSADRSKEPEACPNDGTILERISWREVAIDADVAAERYFQRYQKLKEAWPEGYAMPVEDEDG